MEKRGLTEELIIDILNKPDSICLNNGLHP
ncbi:MAG: hypothetical protein KBI12_06900 [Methanothrix sp.]|nr:hypothetical protein [Methanothrix sp.]